MQLATKHCFHLCHIGQEKDESIFKMKSSMFVKERKKVLELVKTAFEHTTMEDDESIEYALNYGQAFYIVGFGNTYATHHIIAAVLYVMSEEGTYINWLAVTRKDFVKSTYGTHATDKPF